MINDKRDPHEITVPYGHTIIGFVLICIIGVILYEINSIHYGTAHVSNKSAIGGRHYPLPAQVMTNAGTGSILDGKQKYAHKSIEKKSESPNVNTETRTYEEYKANRNKEITPLCANIFLQYEEFFHKSMRNISRLDSYGAYTAARNMKKLMDISINGYQ